MRSNELEQRSSRRQLLRKGASFGFAALAASAAAATLTSTASASGRHSSLPDCLTGGGGSSGGGGALCFLKGTRIETAVGPVAIEELKIGDLIATHRGDYKPLKWVGYMCYRKQTGAAWSGRVEPICITRSAISDNVPSRDLYVSPRHAIYLDGILITAKQLINDVSIFYATPRETDKLEYYQVEFDTHEVVVAEGVHAESFLATPLREMFSNFAEYERLYGTGPVTMEPYAPIYRHRHSYDVLFGKAKAVYARMGLNAAHPVQRVKSRLSRRALNLQRTAVGVDSEVYY